GSAGLDLVVSETKTLTDESISLLPTETHGHLRHGLSALLLGRSSATRQGILVQPGVIDSDYKGKIYIMTRVLNPPVIIPKGSKIAQLIPFCSQVPHAKDQDRGSGGFGSTGPLTSAFVECLSQEKPTCQVRLIHSNPNLTPATLHCTMMIDTESDITVV
ncbi:POK9 protein, partial [Dryoscopus gambensis]|nr:POK9 protein [Dryoscopus gambensis]